MLPEEVEEFAGLECTYEYDDLLLWRKMCNTTIKYETDRMKEIEKKKLEHASKQSYFSRVWGSTGEEVVWCSGVGEGCLGCLFFSFLY
jgi:hypothetical protein